MWSFFLILSFESVSKLLSRVRAVFLSVLQNKSSYFDHYNRQKQHNTMNQIHVTDAKHKTIVSMSGLVLVALLIGWESGAVFFFLLTASKLRQHRSKWKLLSTVNWKLLCSGLDFSTLKHALAQYFCSWVSINLHVPEFFSVILSSLLVNCVSLLQCMNKLKIPGTDS